MLFSLCNRTSLSTIASFTFGVCGEKKTAREMSQTFFSQNFFPSFHLFAVKFSFSCDYVMLEKESEAGANCRDDDARELNKYPINIQTIFRRSLISIKRVSKLAFIVFFTHRASPLTLTRK